MKKVLVLLIVCFIFTNTVSASSIEDQLNELKTDITNLKSEVSNLNSQRLDKTYPIGSIYITTVYSTASQVTSALGGTWETYGSGRTLVGVNTSDSNFDTVSKTGGVATTTLSSSNLPSHTHSIPALSGTAASAGSHTHSIPSLSGSTSTKSLTGQFSSGGGSSVFWRASTSGVFYNNNGVGSGTYEGVTANQNSNRSHTINIDASHNHTVTTNASTSGSSGAHTHTVTTKTSTTGSSGSDTSFTNLQPYITVYMYRRTA